MAIVKIAWGLCVRCCVNNTDIVIPAGCHAMVSALQCFSVSSFAWKKNAVLTKFGNKLNIFLNISMNFFHRLFKIPHHS